MLTKIPLHTSISVIMIVGDKGDNLKPGIQFDISTSSSPDIKIKRIIYILWAVHMCNITVTLIIPPATKTVILTT
jgi:hypothetical protein